ncbi:MULTISPECIES: ADP-ribosylglycohydrolase family protein [unclassified Streptomyces]|uniref:ADP-ribosylglycohydrolase family protein n=1 Tax=unclassified Streptomyces TaxID=2593676 RepID=UPI002258F516|nr:ADP-ribosylglycohydrolase family protein [Streptomyces sp. NBC_00154]MCX5317661.1 ADP-ribosylglycohydrolase family protein [Streptomyces sp. NBC_00154]WTC76876.1 ADP-ribosylglycohydrolase family protein [Streptomyces sp. NBC_01653]WTD93984.1 ADP-ribosylglycohydrolase family protein [Streptomyces sp. NBC_01637]
MTDRLDRALGAYYGLALGDALGMPTQVMSRQDVVRVYGTLTGFEPALPDNPVSAGMPAGSVTDDTDQAVIVGRLIDEGRGRIDPLRLAHDLLDWEKEMRAKGSFDLLGPSTKAALDAVARGVPTEEAGRYGTTNGAAMRVTPVGIAFAVEPLESFLDHVVESCQVTHDTTIGIAGAAAVAAAVSTGVGGGTLGEAVAAAVVAARAGARRGHWIAGADIASRIEWAWELVRGLPEAEALDRICALIGTSVASQESVPAAFAVLAVADGDPWRAALLAANLGGDSDTIGAIAGAIAGSVAGLSALPTEAVRTLRTVNSLVLEPLTARLLALR